MAGRALRTNLSQVTRRVRLFGNIVGWVLGDVYRNAKGQFVLNFALSVLGVIARLGVIAVLMTFVHAQTSGNPVVIRGFELPSDTGFWTLTLWGGSVLLLSVATGLANYLTEVRNFRLAREAMDRAVDRTLAVVTAGQSRPLAVWANDGMKGMARKVVMGDAMMLARSVLLIGGFTVRAHDICDRDGGLVRSGGEPDCWPRGVRLWWGADCCAARCLGSEAAPVNHGVGFGVVRSCARSLVSRVDTLEV